MQSLLAKIAWLLWLAVVSHCGLIYSRVGIPSCNDTNTCQCGQSVNVLHILPIWIRVLSMSLEYFYALSSVSYIVYFVISCSTYFMPLIYLKFILAATWNYGRAVLNCDGPLRVPTHAENMVMVMVTTDMAGRNLFLFSVIPPLLDVLLLWQSARLSKGMNSSHTLKINIFAQWTRRRETFLFFSHWCPYRLTKDDYLSCQSNDAFAYVVHPKNRLLPMSAVYMQLSLIAIMYTPREYIY